MAAEKAKQKEDDCHTALQKGDRSDLIEWRTMLQKHSEARQKREAAWDQARMLSKKATDLTELVNKLHKGKSQHSMFRVTLSPTDDHITEENADKSGQVFVKRAEDFAQNARKLYAATKSDSYTNISELEWPHFAPAQRSDKDVANVEVQSELPVVATQDHILSHPLGASVLQRLGRTVDSKFSLARPMRVGDESPATIPVGHGYRLFGPPPDQPAGEEEAEEEPVDELEGKMSTLEVTEAPKSKDVPFTRPTEFEKRCTNVVYKRCAEALVQEDIDPMCSFDRYPSASRYLTAYYAGNSTEPEYSWNSDNYVVEAEATSGRKKRKDRRKEQEQGVVEDAENAPPPPPPAAPEIPTLGPRTLAGYAQWIARMEAQTPAVTNETLDRWATSADKLYETDVRSALVAKRKELGARLDFDDIPTVKNDGKPPGRVRPRDFQSGFPDKAVLEEDIEFNNRR